MVESSAMVKIEARRRGRRAAVTGAATVIIAALTWPIPLVPFGVLAVGGSLTISETWSWLRYRGRWGLKF